MRLTLLSTAALLGSLAAANAADIIHHPHHSHKKTIIHQPVVIVQQPSAPAFSWAGPYLGAEFGEANSHFYAHGAAKGRPAATVKKLYGKPTTVSLAGIYAGYNMALTQHIILALEGNIALHHSTASSKYGGTTTPLFYSNYKENSMAAARLRLGYAQGRVLPYIAGGLSILHAGHMEGLIAATNIGDIKKTMHYHKGWNLGAGIDYAMSQHLLVRADYRFSQVGIASYFFNGTNNSWGPKTSRLGIKSHQVSLGLAYKF